jgi:hypothetical protein
MITETRTERGRTVLTVETQQEFDQAFGRMLEDHSIDIEASPELLERNGIFDSAEEHGLLDETD